MILDLNQITLLLFIIDTQVKDTLLKSKPIMNLDGKTDTELVKTNPYGKKYQNTITMIKEEMIMI